MSVQGDDSYKMCKLYRETEMWINLTSKEEKNKKRTVRTIQLTSTILLVENCSTNQKLLRHCI